MVYQQEELLSGTNEKGHASIKYHECNKFEHYLSHCPEIEGNQYLMIEEEEEPDDEKEQKDEGANHMKFLVMINEVDLSSSDGSYMVNFRNFQFLKKIKNEQREELTKNLNSIWDNKSIFLDSGSTFLYYNSPKILTDIIKCKKPMNSISNGRVPRYKKIFKTLEKNLIRDFPLIVDDAKRYMNMYNREIAKLKGNKTRSKSSKIQDMVVIPLPLTLVKKHNTESL